MAESRSGSSPCGALPTNFVDVPQFGDITIFALHQSLCERTPTRQDAPRKVALCLSAPAAPSDLDADGSGGTFAPPFRSTDCVWSRQV
jgi:hypothetical protein